MPSPLEPTVRSAELVVDLRADLGEGPIWDARTGTLVFVDSYAGRIHRYSPGSGDLATLSVGLTIGAAIPRAGGGFVASSREGLLAIGEAGEAGDLLVPIEADDPDTRLNDAKCDSRGRLLSGSLSQPFRKGANALYQVSPDLELRTLVEGVTVSNGIAWSPPEDVLYYIDTASRGIDCFDYDIATGDVGNRRRLIDIDRAEGFPDGLTVDREGCLWVAIYLGGKVKRYNPDGRLLSEVLLPAGGVTSCNFGGPDLTQLYITTARHGLSPDALLNQPQSGGLFRLEPGVAGLPSYPFAG